MRILNILNSIQNRFNFQYMGLKASICGGENLDLHTAKPLFLYPHHRRELLCARLHPTTII